MPPDGLGQGLEKGRGLADPVRQGGAVEVEAIAAKDLALPVEGKVVDILAHQHMGEQPGTGTAALNGLGGQRRLGEALAARAGQARAHDPVHHEPAGHILELLRHVLTDPPQRSPAPNAAVALWKELDLLARDVVRDRAALGLIPLFHIRQPQLGRHRGRGDLAGLEGQLQLLGRLGRGAEPVGAVAGELMAQLLDQKRLRLDLGQEPRRKGPQVLGVMGQRSGFVQHGASLAGRVQ